MDKLLFRIFSLIMILALLLPGAAPVEALPEVGYSITGRVTDGNGNGVPGMMVTAVPGAARVQVKNETGAAVEKAQVFRNGALTGITDSDGYLEITNLAVGDQLVARLRILEQPTKRSHHNQDSNQNWIHYQPGYPQGRRASALYCQ